MISVATQWACIPRGPRDDRLLALYRLLGMKSGEGTREQMPVGEVGIVE
jgi:hypothetical protein